jgi:hypothetical protein
MSDRLWRYNLQQDPRYQRGDIDGRRWGNFILRGCHHLRYSRYGWDEREEGGVVMESTEGCWVVNVEAWAGDLGRGEGEGDGRRRGVVSGEVDGRDNWSGYDWFSVWLTLLHMKVSRFSAAC